MRRSSFRVDSQGKFKPGRPIRLRVSTYANIQLNSPDWSIRRGAASRGARPVADATAKDFPREFLTEESEVAEEFLAEPRAATRGQAAAPGALDFSYDLADGEAAILSVRHPSGALTFHVPVQSASRGLGSQPGAICRRCAIDGRRDGETRNRHQSHQGDPHQGGQGGRRQGR